MNFLFQSADWGFSGPEFFVFHLFVKIFQHKTVASSSLRPEGFKQSNFYINRILKLIAKPKKYLKQSSSNRFRSRLSTSKHSTINHHSPQVNYDQFYVLFKSNSLFQFSLSVAKSINWNSNNKQQKKIHKIHPLML